MKRVLKWTGIALGSLIVIAVLATYGVSEYRLHETFEVPTPQGGHIVFGQRPGSVAPTRGPA